jgi:ribonuclease HII
MNISGYDESGRGPVLGPMVLCGAMIDSEKTGELKKLGVKDSKLLTPQTRKKLAKILPNHVQYHLIIVPPNEIDAAVNSTETNLNWLEADKYIEAIKALKPDKAIIDCPSPNIPAFTAYIKNRLELETEIVAEHKADLNHLIVGAASILAKVRRDAEIEKIKQEIGIDFGSGYPTDPKTKKFLAEKWDTYPHIFRNSWAPYKKLIQDAIK